MSVFLIAILAGIGALLFAGILARKVLKADQGNQTMREIGDAVKDGADAFLRREYMWLAPFVLAVTAVLWIVIDFIQLDSAVPRTAIAYLAGTICSATAGSMGCVASHCAKFCGHCAGLLSRRRAMQSSSAMDDAEVSSMPKACSR